VSAPRLVPIAIGVACGTALLGGAGWVALGRTEAAPAPRFEVVTEQQSIVKAVAADILGLAGRTRQESLEGLTVTPVDGAPGRFRLQAVLGRRTLRREIAIVDHVWSAATYGELAREAIGAATAPAAGPEDAGLPERLADLRAAVLVTESRRVSAALAARPLDSQALDQAALVSAAFGWREGPGCTEDPRPALARTTALRALGRAVDGGATRPAAALADAIVAAMIGRQVEAFAILDPLGKDDATAGVRAWARAIAMRMDNDWRRVTDPPHATLVERREFLWSMIMADLGGEQALEALGASGSIDVVDYAQIRSGIMGATVGEGNRVIAAAFPLEMAEVQEVLGATTARTFGAMLGDDTPLPLVHDGTVEVLSRNAWSGFFQRRFLEAALAQRHHLKSMLGHSEKDMESYDRWERTTLGDMPLYPYLSIVRYRKRYDGPPGPEDCRKAAEAAAAAPERIPPMPLFMASTACSAAHGAAAFFTPDIPSGTVFQANLRLYYHLAHADLGRLSAWYALSPHDELVIGSLTEQRIAQGSDYAQVSPLWAGRDAYAIDSYLRELAITPAAERMRMLQRGCAMVADQCLAYGRALVDAQRGEDAAAAFERAFDKAQDRVSVSTSMSWYAGYLLTHGQAARAREIAAAAAEVYSYGGLALQAGVLESMGDATQAEEFWAAAAERYEEEADLLAFHVRQNLRVPAQFAEKAASARQRLFPKGLHRWTPPANAAVPPDQGVRIRYVDSELARQQLQACDIIVAIEGYAVESTAQAVTFRPMAHGTELQLVVWRAGQYLSVAPSAVPPAYKIGVDWEAINRSIEVSKEQRSYGGKAVAEWVQLLVSNASGQDGHRAPAVVARLGYHAVPLLEPVLREPPSDVALTRVLDAYKQMGSWYYLRSAPILLDWLKRGPTPRRLAVLPLLGNLGRYPGVVDALIEAARSSSDAQVRLAALDALGHVGAYAQARLPELEQMNGDAAFKGRLQTSLQRIRVKPAVLKAARRSPRSKVYVLIGCRHPSQRGLRSARPALAGKERPRVQGRDPPDAIIGFTEGQKVAMVILAIVFAPVGGLVGGGDHWAPVPKEPRIDLGLAPGWGAWRPPSRSGF
jgi:hypothetical protein